MPQNMESTRSNGEASVERRAMTVVADQTVGGLPECRLRRVAQYVQDNLHRELRLAELSGLVHMSPYHFARLFRRSAGVSPHRFLVQRRIAQARALLAAQTLPRAAARALLIAKFLPGLNSTRDRQRHCPRGAYARCGSGQAEIASLTPEAGRPTVPASSRRWCGRWAWRADESS